MKLRLLRAVAPAMIACLLFVSCQKTDLQSEESSQVLTTSVAKDLDISFEISAATRKASAKLVNKMKELAAKRPDNIGTYVQQLVAQRKNAVTPTECSSTPFDATITKYINRFGQLELDFYSEYAAINYFAVFLDESEQYFGPKGGQTNNVNRYKSKLEKLWKGPKDIMVMGQHNAVLDDRDRVAEVYMVFVGLPEDVAYAVADEILFINKISKVFIETPLLSFDAFATTDKMIVLGDGIMRLLAESGTPQAIAYAGVLAHEWGHQLQFEKSVEWYGVPPFLWPALPEFTRFVEMEADFFSAYFAGSKRGIALNWQKLAQFFDLFYNIGDCSFTSPSHHGTPLQRMTAARIGYIISQTANYLGFDLAPNDIHTLFVLMNGYIVDKNLNMQAAYAMLKNPQMRSMFTRVLMHRTELQNMLEGRMSMTAIKNLP